MKNTVRNTLFALVLLSFGAALLTNCGGSSYEEVEVPTQGLITTVKEIQTDQWKIEDEVPVPDTAQSLIIAKYMNGNIDTFTLAEARLMERRAGTPGHSIARAASYGFFGYMIGRSFGRSGSGFRPSASAYTDPNTYNRVNNSTGSSVRSSTRTVSRPSSRSSSGYGSGRSSRSYGG